MTDAATEYALVKEKIRGLKAEYCWYFEQLYDRYPRWIYSQNLQVEGLKGLIHKLKLDYGHKIKQLNTKLNTK